MHSSHRFEIHCNLSSDHMPALFQMKEHRSTFFSNFSPWENKQLACVSEHLSVGQLQAYTKYGRP
ncbi:hypothetical protein OIDMADRAFT_17831 [Oidiodendron maius Zn]|uniref:Uncharacterized protein n=1 Tax=Oidiodendron maius (strain Zn) TaxID=913774 RepID=A0A0C3DSM5_OIDMZ|nr:hypothetical protein OIDMADRAFT_17831 [Oidiodendron maius Zn]